MGTIYYGGSATPIHIEDRALAHVKVVVATKLRRGESFTLSWRHPDEETRGRSTIWLHPSIPLRFVFDEPEPPTLSRAWLENLARTANSSGGITLVAEDMEPAEQAASDASPQSVEITETPARDGSAQNSQSSGTRSSSDQRTASPPTSG